MATRSVILSLALAFILSITAFAQEQPSGPVVSVETVHYDIRGSTANQLRGQMDQLGPESEGGRFDASTEWHVQWNYSYSRLTESCAIEEAHVEVQVTYTLPRWNPPADAPRSLVERWRTYMAALQLHEDGHRDVGISAGEEVLSTITELPAERTCPALGRIAHRTANQIITRHEDEERHYDRVTDHGATQGATFP
jgi:predicted secreted Zn-dependent protease